MTPQKEVKTTWSLSYILLTILLSIVTGVLGYGLKYIFEVKPKKVLQVIEEQTGNLIDLPKSVEDKISTSFSLRDESDKTLRSFFKYDLTVRNAGNQSAEAIRISVETANTDVVLLTPPEVSTIPTHMKIGLNAQHLPGASPSRDEWEIPLLNSGEAVQLSYVAYSTLELPSGEFKSTARGKDWIERHESQATEEKPYQAMSRKRLADFRGMDLLILAALILGLYFTLRLYFDLAQNPSMIKKLREIILRIHTRRLIPGTLPEPNHQQFLQKGVRLLYYDDTKRNDILSIFPKNNNLSSRGKATASSHYGEREPSKALKGQRSGDSWSLNGPGGEFQVDWEPPINGRYIILIGRTSTPGSDPWEETIIIVNGDELGILKHPFGGKGVLVLDLGEPTLLRSIKFKINGETYPGLAGLEVHA